MKQSHAEQAFKLVAASLYVKNKTKQKQTKKQPDFSLPTILPYRNLQKKVLTVKNYKCTSAHNLSEHTLHCHPQSVDLFMIFTLKKNFCQFSGLYVLRQCLSGSECPFTASSARSCQCSCSENVKLCGGKHHLKEYKCSAS